MRVEGEQGYVLYEDAGGAERAMPVRSEGGQWKVVSILGSFGLPPVR